MIVDINNLFMLENKRKDLNLTLATWTTKLITMNCSLPDSQKHNFLFFIKSKYEKEEDKQEEEEEVVVSDDSEG